MGEIFERNLSFDDGANAMIRGNRNGTQNCMLIAESCVDQSSGDFHRCQICLTIERCSYIDFAVFCDGDMKACSTVETINEAMNATEMALTKYGSESHAKDVMGFVAEWANGIK